MPKPTDGPFNGPSPLALAQRRMADLLQRVERSLGANAERYRPTEREVQRIEQALVDSFISREESLALFEYLAHRGSKELLSSVAGVLRSLPEGPDQVPTGRQRLTIDPSARAFWSAKELDPDPNEPAGQPGAPPPAGSGKPQAP